MRKCQCGRLKHKHKHNLAKKIIHYKMDTDTTLGNPRSRTTCKMLLIVILITPLSSRYYPPH